MQVVGYRDGLALLQLNCADSLMEFVALHMKTESILAVHKESTTATGGKHYLCDCIISPDLSTFILKPNAMYVLNFCRGEYRNSMKVLSCKENRSVIDNCSCDLVLVECLNSVIVVARDAPIIGLDRLSAVLLMIGIA